MAVISINAEKKSSIDTAIERAAVDSWFFDQIALGFETADGWRLGLGEQDVSLLTGNFVLSQEAERLGLPLPRVIDTAGVSHSLTMEQLTILMLAYGQHRAGLSEEYAARMAAIATGG